MSKCYIFTVHVMRLISQKIYASPAYLTLSSFLSTERNGSWSQETLMNLHSKAHFCLQLIQQQSTVFPTKYFESHV